MTIRAKKGSKNEVFCCSMGKAKEFFKDTEIILDFGYFGKHFVTYPYEVYYNYVRKTVRGTIVCFMSVFSRRENSILSFFMFKADENSEAIRLEFESKYLPEFYRLYTEQVNDMTLTWKHKCMLVELLDGKLILREATL